jgi:hypothetical protein
LSLTSEGAASSDQYLIQHVRLVRLTEDISQIFNDGGVSAEVNHPMSEDKVKFCVKAVEAQIETMRNSIPPSGIGSS